MPTRVSPCGHPQKMGLDQTQFHLNVSGPIWLDMLYDGDHGLAWPPDDAPAYCASLRRFRELPVKRVYPGHYGPMGRKRMLEVIDEQLADLEK